MDLGTLNYHLRARRMQSLWSPFRQVVASVLDASVFQDRSVVLVGPSLGYVLPLEIFRDARSVIAFDHDPVVRMFLKGKMARKRSGVSGSRRSVKVIRQVIHTPRGLQEFSELAGKGSWFVFCNVLGQLKYSWLQNIGREPSEQKLNEQMDISSQWFSGLGHILQNEKWISFHDRISLTDPSAISGSAAKGFFSDKRLSEEALFQKHQALISSASAKSFESHWMDFWRLDEGPFLYAPWKITPTRTQWIEFAGSREMRAIFSAKRLEMPRQISGTRSER